MNRCQICGLRHILSPDCEPTPEPETQGRERKCAKCGLTEKWHRSVHMNTCVFAATQPEPREPEGEPSGAFDAAGRSLTVAELRERLAAAGNVTWVRASPPSDTGLREAVAERLVSWQRSDQAMGQPQPRRSLSDLGEEEREQWLSRADSLLALTRLSASEPVGLREALEAAYPAVGFVLEDADRERIREKIRDALARLSASEPVGRDTPSTVEPVSATREEIAEAVRKVSRTPAVSGEVDACGDCGGPLDLYCPECDDQPESPLFSVGRHRASPASGEEPNEEVAMLCQHRRYKHRCGICVEAAMATLRTPEVSE